MIRHNLSGGPDMIIFAFLNAKIQTLFSATQKVTWLVLCKQRQKILQIPFSTRNPSTMGFCFQVVFYSKTSATNCSFPCPLIMLSRFMFAPASPGYVPEPAAAGTLVSDLCVTLWSGCSISPFPLCFFSAFYSSLSPGLTRVQL